MAVVFTGAGVGVAASGASPQTVTTTAAFAPGDVFVVLMAYDNSGGGGADPMSGTVSVGFGSSVSAQTGINDPGAASAGLAVRCVAFQMSSVMSSGTGVFVTWSGTVVVRAIAFMKVSSNAGGTIGFRANSGAVGTNGVAVTTVAHTTPSVNSGEGVLCWAGHENGAAITGDADTTNGTWSAVYGTFTGATLAGQAAYFQSKVVTATATQTWNPTGASSDWIVGSLIFTETLNPSITQAAYRFYDQGTESGSIALQPQDTAHTGDLGGGDGLGHLRVRLQSTTANAVPATDDFQLQWEKNASGSWTNVGTGAVIGYNDPNLTDAAVTTSRLTAGTGSFVAGKVSEDGLADNVGWTANNYTELLFSLQFVKAQLADADTIRFRVLRNGATTGMTYTATPTITLVLPPPKTGTATGAHAWAPSAVGKKTQKGAATTTWAVASSAVGVTPIVVPPGARVTESGVVRITEAGDPRLLESAPRVQTGVAGLAWIFATAAAGVKPAVPPNEGSATVTWAETLTSAGKRTPKATATTQWTEAPAAAGKKVPKATAITSWAETLAAAGKRVARSVVTTQWAELVTAAGKRAPIGNAITAWAETLTAAGRKTQQGAAMTAHAWAPSAVGVTPAVGMKQGTAAVTWTETPIAVGRRIPKASATVTYTQAVTASGAKPLRGSAITSWAETLAAAGKRVARSVVTTAATWSPSAIGKRVAKSTVTTSWTEVVTSVGKRDPRATVTTSYLETLSGAGKRVPKGATTASHSWIPAAVGKRPQGGSATTSHLWTQIANGRNTISMGIGAASTSWSTFPTASGKRTPKGSRTVTYAFALSVTSKRTPKSVVTTSWAEALSVQGKRVPKGSHTLAHIWAVAAAGIKYQRGAATVVYLWQPSAAGKKLQNSAVVVFYDWAVDATGYRMSVGSGDTDYWFSQVALGIEGLAGRVEGIWNDQPVVEMNYGGKAVIDWLLIPS